MTETSNQHISSAEIMAFAEINVTLGFIAECQRKMEQHPDKAGAIAKRCMELVPTLLKQSQEASAAHDERLAYWVKRMGLDEKK